jgi:peptidoglycan hydrolase-like protein with peptidoglycan-binding domain
LPPSNTGTGTPTTTGSSGGTGYLHYFFTRNLALWDTGYDVLYLQQFLIAQNIGPAARAIRAHGLTRTYGSLTLTAVQELQRSIGEVPTGYFGLKTRAYVNALNR